MSMGKRKRHHRQASMWVATQELPRSAGHPFYSQLNRVLDKAGFDGYAEQVCARFYSAEQGRPSMPPGRYFRLLMVGYFEGIDSERGIAWRATDSLSLRQFLGLELNEAPPDHSTISRTRQRIDVDTHRSVFTWMLDRLTAAGLVKGKTLGIDSTTLEANAALRSIVRRDTGESYESFLTRLAQASGIETPTREDLARLDRQRPKKASNDDWENPHDPDARITKMKDGRTHLAHKAEHAVDLDTGAVVAVTVQPADEGDTKSIEETVAAAAENLEKAKPDHDGIQELVADKGYHSNEVLVALDELEVRSYISEPARGRRRWKDKEAARHAVYSNRRRIRGDRGRRLLRRRGERLERPFAHAYETGRLRRLYLRGRSNILKRILIHHAALNLGLLMRNMFGVGTPRSLQGRLAAAFSCLFAVFHRFWAIVRWSDALITGADLEQYPVTKVQPRRSVGLRTAFATAC
jgi:transposase